MARRARLSGFDMEEVAERFPESYELAKGRGGRHGEGLGLRPTRYVGKHRFLERLKPNRAERRGERRRPRKANDFGFGS